MNFARLFGEIKADIAKVMSELQELKALLKAEDAVVAEEKEEVSHNIESSFEVVDYDGLRGMNPPDSTPTPKPAQKRARKAI